MDWGEVWVCRFGSDIGTRPVAIVSSNTLNDVRSKVTVAVGTTQHRSIPTEVPIGKAEGLLQEGVLSASDLYTVSKNMLVRRAGVLNPAKKQLLKAALILVLELPTQH